MHDHQRWKDLCEQADVEQDPKKLMEIAKEIYWLLAEKQHRLEAKLPGKPGVRDSQNA